MSTGRYLPIPPPPVEDTHVLPVKRGRSVQPGPQSTTSSDMMDMDQRRRHGTDLGISSLTQPDPTTFSSLLPNKLPRKPRSRAAREVLGDLGLQPDDASTMEDFKRLRNKAAAQASRDRRRCYTTDLEGRVVELAALGATLSERVCQLTAGALTLHAAATAAAAAAHPSCGIVVPNVLASLGISTSSPPTDPADVLPPAALQLLIHSKDKTADATNPLARTHMGMPSSAAAAAATAATAAGNTTTPCGGRPSESGESSPALTATASSYDADPTPQRLADPIAALLAESARLSAQVAAMTRNGSGVASSHPAAATHGPSSASSPYGSIAMGGTFGFQSRGTAASSSFGHMGLPAAAMDVSSTAAAAAATLNRSSQGPTATPAAQAESVTAASAGMSTSHGWGRRISSAGVVDAPPSPVLGDAFGMHAPMPTAECAMAAGLYCPPPHGDVELACSSPTTHGGSTPFDIDCGDDDDDVSPLRHSVVIAEPPRRRQPMSVTAPPKRRQLLGRNVWTPGGDDGQSPEGNGRLPRPLFVFCALFAVTLWGAQTDMLPYFGQDSDASSRAGVTQTPLGRSLLSIDTVRHAFPLQQPDRPLLSQILDSVLPRGDASRDDTGADSWCGALCGHVVNVWTSLMESLGVGLRYRTADPGTLMFLIAAVFVFFASAIAYFVALRLICRPHRASLVGATSPKFRPEETQSMA